jgi:hypothetical protein
MTPIHPKIFIGVACPINESFETKRGGGKGGEDHIEKAEDMVGGDVTTVVETTCNKLNPKNAKV